MISLSRLHFWAGLAVICVFSGTVGFSQAPESKQIKTRFTLLLWHSGGEAKAPAPKFEFQSGSKTKALGFAPTGFSDEVDYEGPSHVVFFQTIPAEPKPIIKILATVDIPPDCNQALLLVLHAPEGSATPYIILPVRSDIEALPLDHAKLINLSGQALAAKALDRVFNIPPRESVVIDYSGVKNNNLPLALATEVNGQVEVVMNSGYAVFPGTRKLLLAFADPEVATHWCVKELDQPPPPPPPKAGPAK